MFTYLRNAYYLSLPVVVGAVLSNRMAARLSDVEPMHWATPVVLGLVVYVIYTLDRLLDVRRYAVDAGSQPLTPRHRFHNRQAPLLWGSVLGASILSLILVFFLPGSVVRFGLVLGSICIAYVLTVFRLPARHPALLLKEPLVAVLYAVGVWGSVWVQRPAVSGAFIAEFGMFMAIAFQNLLLFAVMEQRETPRQPMFSLATVWGDARCFQLLRWLTVGVVAAAFGLCFLTDDRFAQRSALMLGIMSLSLYGIQRHPATFLRHERYRWLGDGIFWLPALVL